MNFPMTFTLSVYTYDVLTFDISANPDEDG